MILKHYNNILFCLAFFNMQQCSMVEWSQCLLILNTEVLFFAFWWDSERVNIGTNCILSVNSCSGICWLFGQLIQTCILLQHCDNKTETMCTLYLLLSREPYKGFCVYYFVCYHKENRQTFFSHNDTAVLAGPQGQLTQF